MICPYCGNLKASGLKIHIEKPLNHGTTVLERRKHEQTD